MTAPGLTAAQANEVFRGVLGRDAQPWEIDAWNNVGVTPETLNTSLQKTGEYQDRWAGVTATRNALGRDPNANELAQLVAPASVYRGATGSDLAGTTSWLTNQLKGSSGNPFAPAPTPQTTPTRPMAPGMGGGQPDWLGGILGQLFGADRMLGGMNMASWPAGGQPTDGGMGYSTMPAMRAGGNMASWGWSGDPRSNPFMGGGANGTPGHGGGSMPRNNQFTDLFGASPGQFGSGATSGQQTSAMSNPLSASPFGRGFSTRQMGIPARNLV